MTEHLALKALKLCGETYKPFDFYRETEAEREKKKNKTHLSQQQSAT